VRGREEKMTQILYVHMDKKNTKKMRKSGRIQNPLAGNILARTELKSEEWFVLKYIIRKHG
jgi:hypothetical protein